MLNTNASARPYLITSGMLFAVVTAAHVLRVVNDWPLRFAGTDVPQAASIVAAIATAALAAWAIALAHRHRS